jgi:hypothetical protein
MIKSDKIPKNKSQLQTIDGLVKSRHPRPCFNLAGTGFGVDPESRKLPE